MVSVGLHAFTVTIARSDRLWAVVLTVSAAGDARIRFAGDGRIIPQVQNCGESARPPQQVNRPEYTPGIILFNADVDTLSFSMGYTLNRFTESVDANLTCAICGGVLEDAVLTPCGHSFCQPCIATWLSRSNNSSNCPECRGKVSNTADITPILSVRNLVKNLLIQCDNWSSGCRSVVKLENLRGHLRNCEFVAVECPRCGLSIVRSMLADHQVTCEAIVAALFDDADDPYGRAAVAVARSENIRQSFTCCSTRGEASTNSCSAGGGDGAVSDLPHQRSLPCEVTDLACRVATLEVQLKRLRRELEAADMKNRRLERELKRTKAELEEKRIKSLDQQYVEFDPDYDYGHDPDSIVKLACVISRFLLKRPTYVDRNKVFSAIKRCYENYSRSGDEYEHDVHMLVATAYASNWFSDTQKLSFHCWLQSIARYRQFSLDPV